MAPGSSHARHVVACALSRVHRLSAQWTLVGRPLTAGEGVHADVQAAVLKGEAQVHGHLVAQLRLLLGVVLAPEPLVCGRRAREAGIHAGSVI